LKIIAFDTESTDLSASWGRILCASFVEWPSGEVCTLRGDRGKKPEDKDWKFLPGTGVADDSRLVEAIRDELETADVILSWNGILHDIPLLNARLQVAGKREYRGKQWPKGSHLDLMYYASGQSLKIGGKRLETVAKFFQLPNQKTPLDGATWQKAGVGDREAMDLVCEHCEADALVLRDTFPILAPHVKKLSLPLWWEFADKVAL
jgi:uncharacterized protein YprB with RNaseH-like and TPR domain